MSLAVREQLKEGFDTRSFRVPERFRPELARRKPGYAIAQAVVKSSRHAYIDSERRRLVSGRFVSENLWIIDAVRASKISPYDPRKVPPTQVGKLLDRVIEYAPLIAEGKTLPAGISTLPDGAGLPTIYMFQSKRTGPDQDLTAFVARDLIADPTKPNTLATIFSVAAICRNDEVSKVTDRFTELGYGRRDAATGKANTARR